MFLRIVLISCIHVSHAHLDIPPHSSGNHGNSCTGTIQVCLCSWHGNRKVLGRPGDTHQHLKNEKSTFDIIMYYLSITIHNITTGFRSQALIRDFIYTCMYICEGQTSSLIKKEDILKCVRVCMCVCVCVCESVCV